jgi:hypothetical protein
MGQEIKAGRYSGSLRRLGQLARPTAADINIRSITIVNGVLRLRQRNWIYSLAAECVRPEYSTLPSPTCPEPSG